jgi:tetratricopeptide (TPR) repeat protein/S1-C subfamily serine protease
MKKHLITTFFLTTSLLPASLPAHSNPSPTKPRLAQADLNEGILTPQQVRATAKNISVRITAENNGGSGVIIAKKGSNYLILTNAHVVGRATKIEIIAPDGQKYRATPINGGFDPKYDLALLQFTSKTKYTLANLSSIAGSPIEPERTIYSAGFPFDSKDLRITSGQVSQLSDLPFNDGTQIGYVTDKGKKGIRQGMSGGAIFDAQGNLLGINTTSVAPILPKYTYNDGSKPIPELAAKYARANWGIPVYNFLTNANADILYGYDNLPKVEHKVTPTGYLANLNIKARQMTVRIENSGGTGSGVIIAREGNSYYVLTAKHVLQNPSNGQKLTGNQIITYDQVRHSDTGSVVAEGVDLAVVKFSSNSRNNYPVAQLSEYSTKDDDLVFVGGFPGRQQINSPLWQWQLNPGFILDRESGKVSTQDSQSFLEGYDLIYGSITYEGMSGAPIFDPNGNVIGIHGKTEVTGGTVSLGGSLGISIQTFISLANAKKMQVNTNSLKIVKGRPIDLSPANRASAIAAMQNIPKPQDGGDGERWLAYGNQLLRVGKNNDSVAAFDKAIAKGQVLRGNYGRALSLALTGKFDLAEIAIAKAIAVVPPKERAIYSYFWKYQSYILLQSKQYDLALKSIDVALQLDPSNRSLPLFKTAALMGSKKLPEALKTLNKTISDRPSSYDYTLRGLIKLILGDKQGAMADCNTAIKLNPGLYINYFTRATVKNIQGDKQAAFTDYNQTIKLKPNYAPAYIGRGGIKFDLQGDIPGAIADYSEAIKIEPSNYEARTRRAAGRILQQDLKGAIDDCDRAIEFNRNDFSIYLVRGIAKFNFGKTPAAIVDLDRGIALNPNFDQAYIKRGFYKMTIGRDRDALVDIERAIKLDPNDSENYAIRGFIRESSGDRQGAIVDYKRAIQLNNRLIGYLGKQSKFVQKYNNVAYAKYQQIIQKLTAVSKLK